MLGSVNRLRDLQILAEEAEAVTAPVTTEKERGNMVFFFVFFFEGDGVSHSGKNIRFSWEEQLRLRGWL